MSEFMWGLVVGIGVGPLAWEGARWCMRKVKEATSK